MSRRSTAAIATVLVAAGFGILSEHAHAATVTLSSCGQAAVQAAVNAASDGDTIVVPNGTCEWTGAVSVSKAVRIRAQTSRGVTLLHSAGGGTLFNITAPAGGNVQISGFRFLPGTVTYQGFYVDVAGRGRPVLINDNYFRVRNFVVSCIRWGARGGVVFDNEFESLDPNGAESGCIPIKAEDPVSDVSWTTPPTWGAQDVSGDQNVYFERNTFRKILAQSFDPDGNARVVIRYNTFDNSGMASHGADTGPDGMRHAEVYNNTFVFSTSGTGYNFPLPLNWWIYIRGGSWVITDNVMPNIASQMWNDKPEIVATVQNLRRNSGPYPCWRTYPAPRQFGQGFDGARAITDPAYLWNNTGTGLQTPAVSDYNPDACGNNTSTADFIRAGRDFFVGTPRPGYAKYTYPHPLTAATTAPPPSPPTSLRAQ